MGRKHYFLQELGARATNSDPPPAACGHILIADEDAKNHVVPLSEAFPACRFILATTPAAARRLFLSTPLDLILLCHSDSFCGLDLLAAFKTQRPSVPVIVITASGSEVVAVQAFRRGAIDYFRKPFVLDELTLSMLGVLEISTQLRGQRQALPCSGLHRALQYLETHFQKPLRLEEVAREAGMSVACFQRHLKEDTGMTFIPYLNSLRIARAREMLRTTKTSMLRIALSCGFINQSHFNRVFKKIAGRTPRECRKLHPIETSKM